MSKDGKLETCSCDNKNCGCKGIKVNQATPASKIQNNQNPPNSALNSSTNKPPISVKSKTSKPNILPKSEYIVGIYQSFINLYQYEHQIQII